MPGFYKVGEYDLAGFIVGVVDKARIVDGSSIRPGDVVGTALSWLAYERLFPGSEAAVGKIGIQHGTRLPGLKKPIGETLLAPTSTTCPFLKPLVDRKWIKGMAHITGGGLTENIPRILPWAVRAIVRVGVGPVSRSSAFFQKWAD
jgi:phosphoribosylformylglycinamidine cyclo-ligase